MDYRLICQWLGLPPTPWPPDHYTLLGLPPGEADGARIEQHAQERLQRLRCYQISHADQATEAMNRLAQALVCLTDPAAKLRYDASLGLVANGAATQTAPPAPPPVLAPAPPPLANGPAAPAVLPADLEETAVNAPQTRLDWDVTPPPIRVPRPPEADPPAEAPAAPQAPEAPAPPAAPAAAPALPSQPADPVLAAARTSREARRGLGTRRALYERLVATRDLLRAWDLAGRYLSRPGRRPRPTESTDLTRRLLKVDRLLLDFPPLVGPAGQPGYRVVILAREQSVARAFKDLDADAREALALDWKVGRAVLLAHLRFVRDEVRAVRRQGRLKRVLRAASAWVNDHPGWVTAAVVLALGLALLSIATLY
jgi:hypothetical protein